MVRLIFQHDRSVISLFVVVPVIDADAIENLLFKCLEQVMNGIRLYS